MECNSSTAVACRKRRKVKNCNQCLRYKECYQGASCIPAYYTGCLRLGLSIILGVTEQYTKAYKKGKKRTCDNLEKWFKSERTYILSDEKFDGQAIIDALKKKCQREFGNIDDIYKAKRQKAKNEIANLKLKASNETDPKKKRKYIAKAVAIRGELNE